MFPEKIVFLNKGNELVLAEGATRPYWAKGDGLENMVVLKHGRVAADEWENNVPFTGVMEFQPNRTFEVRDIETGKRYRMFPSDVNSLIVQSLLMGSRVSGTWQVYSRINKWGLKRIGA